MGVTAFDTAWVQGVVGVLGLIVILAMVLERALSIVFEWGLWDVWLASKNLRAPLSVLASHLICAYMKLDILLTIGKQDASKFELFSIGKFVTAATDRGRQ